ncbi:MAG: YceI family protein [Steroidobacteraceae bacterium]
MKIRQRGFEFLLGAMLVAVVAACAPKEPAAEKNADAQAATAVPAASAAPVPAGSYTLDQSHASLLFRVNHLGFSNFTARFKRFEAQLQFDPNNLSASTLTATVDAKTLETDYPDPATLDFNAELQNDQWLDTARFPQITFRSVRIETTGKQAMRIDGELTLRGVTHPVTLDATYNGGYAGHPMDPHARIGFSAHGSFNRSDFGIAYGIPAPGTTMGVSDRVDVIIECEFTGPPLAGSAHQ